jgi:heme transporter
VTDPLAFTGCGRNGTQTPVGVEEGFDESRGLGPGQIPHQVDISEEKVGAGVAASGSKTGSNGQPNGPLGAKKLVGGLASRNGIAKAIAGADRPVHPVTLWRGRLSVAIDALQSDSGPTNPDQPKWQRRSPVETTQVQLPTGDRLLVPTGAETLRLKGYLIMSRNSSRDFAEFADMVDTVEPETAALVLAGMDRYYCCQPPRQQWIASQLVRQLADPHPADFTDEQLSKPDVQEDWDEVRQRCLSVAVAMLEEAR